MRRLYCCSCSAAAARSPPRTWRAASEQAIERLARRAHGLLGRSDRRSGERPHAGCPSTPDRFFVPASNTKLFTTALGLSRLGADYRYETVVLCRARAG